MAYKLLCMSFLQPGATPPVVPIIVLPLDYPSMYIYIYIKMENSILFIFEEIWLKCLVLGPKYRDFALIIEQFF